MYFGSFIPFFRTEMTKNKNAKKREASRRATRSSVTANASKAAERPAEVVEVVPEEDEDMERNAMEVTSDAEAGGPSTEQPKATLRQMKGAKRRALSKKGANMAVAKLTAKLRQTQLELSLRKKQLKKARLATKQRKVERVERVSDGQKPRNFRHFENKPKQDRLREFRDWMETVYDAMHFAKNWTEVDKFKCFRGECGPYLQSLIKVFNLEPEASETPFTDVVANIDKHFQSLLDPALDHQAILKCRQEVGESAEDFHLRLMQLARHKDYDMKLIRSHFLAGLIDQGFANLAITTKMSLTEIVESATRREQMGAGVAGANPLSVAAVARGRQAGGYYQRQPQRYTTAPPRAQGPQGSRANVNWRATQRGCPSCGIVEPHRFGTCPAKAPGRTCTSCGKAGHFAKVCRASANRQAPRANTRPASCCIFKLFSE